MGMKLLRRDLLLSSAVIIAVLFLSSVSSFANEKNTVSQTKKTIKVGLLTNGEGAHLGAYYQALAKAEEVEVVVLADPDGKIEAPARAVLGDKLVRVYKDYKELLKQEWPEMALVSIEAKLAPALIKEALSADCHVFAEKPACVSTQQFEELAAIADQKNKQLMLAFTNRFSPLMVEAKRLISSGAIGTVRGLEMHIIADQTRLTNSKHQKSWLADKERAGGGHLSWLGIHWLDAAMFVTGSNISQVSGFNTNIGGQPVNIEDSAVVSLKFENGSLGTLTSGYYLKRGYHSSIQIWGSKGWLTIKHDSPFKLEWQSDLSEEPKKIHEFIPSSRPNTYHTFVRGAARACAGLEEFPITTKESLHAIKAVFGSYQAAETGQVHSLK